MNDIQKRIVCDILDFGSVNLRKALDAHFKDLKLVKPTSEDYHLLDRKAVD